MPHLATVTREILFFDVTVKLEVCLFDELCEVCVKFISRISRFVNTGQPFLYGVSVYITLNTVINENMLNINVTYVLTLTANLSVMPLGNYMPQEHHVYLIIQSLCGNN